MTSLEPEGVVNMEQKVDIDHITITDNNGTTTTIGRSDIVWGQVNKSAQSYVDKCYFQVNNKTKNVFPLFGIDSEVNITLSPN